LSIRIVLHTPLIRIALHTLFSYIALHTLCYSYAAHSDGLIRLNTVVSKVTRSKRGCTVHTVDGQKYKAHSVICTLPLGVLKVGSAMPPPAYKTATHMVSWCDYFPIRYVSKRWV
jgi:monoamine oxidase